MKLASKERIGPTYRKRYDKARPPFQCLLERDDVSEPCKAAVLALKNATGLLEQQTLLNRAIENLEQIENEHNTVLNTTGIIWNTTSGTGRNMGTSYLAC
jgi:hypothetical protein